MNEFQQHLTCLHNVYKMVLPPTTHIDFFIDSTCAHLEIYLEEDPTVIHNCWKYMFSISTNRIELVLGELT